MSKYIIIFYIIFIKLFPETINEFSGIGVGFQTRESKDLKENKYNGEINSLIGYTLRANSTNSEKRISSVKYDIELNTIVDIKNSNQIKLYPGNNAYFKSDFNKFSLIIGRKSFSSLYRADSYWNDGVEGISITSDFRKAGKFNLYIFDIYRGFPLLKNEFLFQKPSEPGNRLRYGFGYDFENKLFKINYQFGFTQFLNWGIFSEDKQNTEMGDGDYIYHNSLTLGNRSDYFFYSFTLMSSRGLDRTVYNSYRKSSQLLFSGEALNLNIGFEYSKIKSFISLFIPDSNKLNKQGEILELGYVGMGAYYAEGFLLSQYINFLPSNWITGKGLEISNSFVNGRTNSYYQKFKFTYNFSYFNINFISEVFIPYRDGIELSGNIYTDKKYFSKFFYHEISGVIETKNILNEELVLKLQISKLTNNSKNPLEGSSLFVSGGIKF